MRVLRTDPSTASSRFLKTFQEIGFAARALEIARKSVGPRPQRQPSK
jgi:hypothetical protein